MGVKGYIYDSIAHVHGLFEVADTVEGQHQTIRQWWAVFESRIADRREAARDCFKIITAGGSFDNVPQAPGSQLPVYNWWEIAIRPGRPLLLP